jgi:hypothetical protein
MELSGSFMKRPLYWQVKRHRYTLDRTPSAESAEEKNPCLCRELKTPNFGRSYVILTTELTRPIYTRAVWKIRGLTLLLPVGALWRCGDGLFVEVPPLVSDALLTTLHTFLENVLQTVSRKLQEDSGTGAVVRGSSFTFVSPSLKRFHHLKTAARLISSSP